MMKLNIEQKEYKVKFGYNCFCDTDLMDKVQSLAGLFSKEETSSDAEVGQIGKMKDLFCVVRELLFVGFTKYNPVSNVQEVGDILDLYIDEETEEKRGLLELFTCLSDELLSGGFLSSLMGEAAEDSQMENGAKKPTDHKKVQK